MTLTTISAHALVPTDSASKYLQQLCKHWQHNLQVEFTPENGTVVFPGMHAGRIIRATLS